MRHTGGPLAAISMVVQLEAYGLEARFWTTFAFRAECSL